MIVKIDLTQVPTRKLVEEAQRRAPSCPKDDVPMLVGPNWFTCPACRMTVDF